MESPSVSRIFRNLFSHQICSKLRYNSARSFGSRTQSTPKIPPPTKPRKITSDDPANADSTWQQRTKYLQPDRQDEYNRYDLVTANDLRGRKSRPKRMKMLMRDFIEDSLYNPNYGYFSKQAVIFNPGKAFEFNAMANESEFYRLLGQRYTQFEDDLDAVKQNDVRQLWHTPTELFRPYYGEAIARAIVENYKLKHHPYHDLIIYEMGAGNGTMMLNILDHIRDLYPEIYEQTQFRIIEISAQLAELQIEAAQKGHLEHVSIVNTSIFDWDTFVPEPCWFLALEVFDNFPHDVMRYDPDTKQPMQGEVLIDSEGEFYEFYVPNIDPIATRFLELRQKIFDGHLPKGHPLRVTAMQEFWRRNKLFAANLSPPDYIPTRLMQFFEVLRDYFPLHQLLTSDFHELPDAVEGYNAPVVQTRYRRRVVPVRTPLVHQGYFDIMFPTDFNLTADLYRNITGKFGKVSTHREFLSQWAYTEDTRTQSGENPMLSWYRNASVMVTE